MDMMALCIQNHICIDMSNKQKETHGMPRSSASTASSNSSASGNKSLNLDGHFGREMFFTCFSYIQSCQIQDWHADKNNSLKILTLFPISQQQQAKFPACFRGFFDFFYHFPGWLPGVPWRKILRDTSRMPMDWSLSLVCQKKNI